MFAIGHYLFGIERSVSIRNSAKNPTYSKAPFSLSSLPLSPPTPIEDSLLDSSTQPSPPEN